jgi:hypothetical protein
MVRSVGAATETDDMRVCLRRRRRKDGTPKTMHQVEYITCYVDGSRVSWGVNVEPGWFIKAHRWQQLTDLGEHPRAADLADAVIERGRAIAQPLNV